MRLPIAFAAVFALALGACVSDEDADDPTPDEISQADTWATTADGKADLPPILSSTVAWLEDIYTNKMSAVATGTEHPATPAAAITRAAALAQAGGVTDPQHKLFVATVQRMHTAISHVDHSEIEIQMSPGHVLRLIGDPKGAGAFVGTQKLWDTVGTPLCLNWTELQTAITASYLPGNYALDFVCHTVTETVLRALHVGTSTYSSQVSTYSVARYIWGPLLPSWNSSNPSSWDVSRSCH